MQVTDFIAYENYKLAMRLQGTKVRVSFADILDLDSFGGRGVNLIPSELTKIRKALSTGSFQKILNAAGIWFGHQPKRR